MKTVAVITSTIGRSHLERAILSVQKQTYPCKHYVFVDGEQFAKDAKQILDKYPHVIATYILEQMVGQIAVSMLSPPF